MGCPQDSSFYVLVYLSMGNAAGSDGKESAYNVRNLGLIPGLGRSPGGEHCNPSHYWLENSHGQRCLAGYHPCGHKESDTTEQLSREQHNYPHCITVEKGVRVIVCLLLTWTASLAIDIHLEAGDWVRKLKKGLRLEKNAQSSPTLLSLGMADKLEQDKIFEISAHHFIILERLKLS